MKKIKKRIFQIGGIVLLILLSFFIGTKRGVSKANDNAHAKHAKEENATPTVWTCSMHPSVQLPKFGQCPICFMDLIPLDPASMGGDPNAPVLSISENARMLAGIVTTPVLRKGVAQDIKMVGKVGFDESRVEKISARIGGRIDHLFVVYTGVQVKKGDHLAEIYSPELLSLQKELIEAANAVKNMSSGISDMVQNSARMTFKAAREKLRLLGFTEKELEVILSRGKTSDHMTIRSTQRGIVLKKFVEEGEYVKMGMPLFQIVDLRKVWVKLDVYESDLSWLRLGQKVSFSVEAYPGDAFRGKISFIDPIVNPKTRTIMVRVLVDNKDKRLKPDMFVKAVVKVNVSRSGRVVNKSMRGKFICPMHPEIVEDSKGICSVCRMDLEPASQMGYVTSDYSNRRPLIIPASAPLFTGERAVVYVEDMEADIPTFIGKTVVLGPRAGKFYIIKSGLKEGDNVVVNGAFKIDGELQIRARPSMMSPRKKKVKNVFVAEQKFDKVKGEVSVNIRKSLGKIFTTYLTLSDMLATDNYKGTKKALDAYKKAVDNTVVENNKKYSQLKKSIEIIQKKLDKIKFVQTIDEARNMFEIFSDQTIILEKVYGHKINKKLNLTFCPMAFDDKGAYWLQTSDVVNNPYYGSKMLKCGTIKKSYNPVK